jgi:hypothetical protein
MTWSSHRHKEVEEAVANQWQMKKGQQKKKRKKKKKKKKKKNKKRSQPASQPTYT